MLTLLLLCVACTSAPSDSGGETVLYFVSTDRRGQGSALESEPYTGAVEQPGPGELLSALLAGPTYEGLAAPFPRGTSLLSWEWDAARPNNLRVRLSEQYGGLADVSLTLADYCIVLTLSQIEGVETVEILAGRYASNYRSHALLRADEVELFDQAAHAVQP